MAIEIYHTLKSDKNQHRKWHDSGIMLRGSWTTFMAGLRHIEKKYLPSVELDHPILWAEREQGEYCSRMTLAMCLSMPFEREKETIKAEVDKLWDLELDPRLSEADSLFFSSLMDRAAFSAEDAEKIAEAWRKVSDEMGDASKEDFHALADAVCKFVSENKDVCHIGINWNSVNYFYDIFGETDEKCYDFVKYLNKKNDLI